MGADENVGFGFAVLDPVLLVDWSQVRHQSGAAHLHGCTLYSQTAHRGGDGVGNLFCGSRLILGVASDSVQCPRQVFFKLLGVEDLTARKIDFGERTVFAERVKRCHAGI